MAVDRVVVTGAAGQLGTELARAFAASGAEVVPMSRPEFELAAATFVDVIGPLKPTVIVNAAAWTDVDGCARAPDRALELNGTAVGRLAAAASVVGARFLQISTNEVFDGAHEQAYRENDEPRPPNAYGRSKLAGEVAALASGSRCTIVRTAWVFGGPRSFPAKIRAAAEVADDRGDRLRVVADEVGNPTPASQLAERIAQLTRLPTPPMIIHLAGEPPVSRYSWAECVLSKAGRPTELEPISLSDYPRASTPPKHAVLDTGLSRQLGLAPIDWRSES